MRALIFGLGLTVLAAPLTARGDDAADAKAVIEKAIAARGDKSGSKFTATTWKDKGTFTAAGITLPYTAEWAFQGPDKYRFILDAALSGTKINVVIVASGERAWGMEAGKTEEFNGEKLEQTLNEAYQLWVTSLRPLVSEKGFTLATAKGVDVAGKPTVAVKVSAEKRPDITLYFDKQTGLLARRDVKVKDEFQKWKEVLDEAYFWDYKETADGKRHFTKLKIVRDGKPTIESTLYDMKEIEKLDAKLFEKP